LEGGSDSRLKKELHKLCASTYIIRVIISRQMRWVGHVAHHRKWNTAFYSSFVYKQTANKVLYIYLIFLIFHKTITVVYY